MKNMFIYLVRDCKCSVEILLGNISLTCGVRGLFLGSQIRLVTGNEFAVVLSVFLIILGALTLYGGLTRNIALQTTCALIHSVTFFFATVSLFVMRMEVVGIYGAIKEDVLVLLFLSFFTGFHYLRIINGLYHPDLNNFTDS
jgi:hypothetical protein